MSGGVEIIGLAGLRENIERAIQDGSHNVERAVSDIGDVGVHESFLRAPQKDALLDASITKEVGRDEDGCSVAIKVPSDSPAAQYALPMHEGNYNLGENSQGKERRYGATVGRKFITRGIEAGKAKFITIIHKWLGV